jgi:hypothetical protein
MFGRHRADDGLRIDPVVPVDIDGLRQAGTSVEEIDGITYGTRILWRQSLDLHRRLSSPDLRTQAWINAEQLRADMDRLLDLRLERWSSS